MESQALTKYNRIVSFNSNSVVFKYFYQKVVRIFNIENSSLVIYEI